MSRVETAPATSNATSPSTNLTTSVIAVYPDHASAEAAVRKLIKEGFPMNNVSIVGRDFEVEEDPIGFLSSSDFVKVGAGTGAWVGGLFGLLMGAAFLVVPGVGPMVVAGPLVGSLLGGIEGALAGAAVGALTGALVSLGVPKDQALKYEAQVKAGKFLVVVRGTPEEITRAQAILSTGKQEDMQVYETAPAV
jgi:hypothetical protein